MNIRGIFTTFLIGMMFIGADLIQRTVVVGLIKLRPLSRNRILTDWTLRLGAGTRWILESVGGAKLDVRPRISSDSGVLILMNHQSLMDIPLAYACLKTGYALFVTRDRYRKGVPLISHMIRLYGHPTVRPGERRPGQLEALRKMAKTSTRAIVIYPEGSRTRDGEIRPFKPSGLRAILSAREWTVHVVVVDGVWQSAGIRGFMNNVTSMHAIADSVGPFQFDPGKDDANAFIASMEQKMRAKLKEMRESKNRDSTS